MMARIRTIKPEFPQSESMGRVSRDARLLFILLWPICDDHGRTRADSRMLASLLFPYDNEPDSVARTTRHDVTLWLDELEREGCIHRYESSGSQYLEICKWLTHQKIDKPSKPQFPIPIDSPREDSRTLPVGREGKGREGNGEEDNSPAGADDNETAPAEKKTGTQKTPASRGTRMPDDWTPDEELKAWTRDKVKGTTVNPANELESFRDHWKAKTGADATKADWNATWRTWIRNAVKWAAERGGSATARARSDAGSVASRRKMT